MDYNFKYFALLILLYLISLILKTLIKFPFVNKDMDLIDFLKVLNDNYYMKNKLFVMFMLIFYFISSSAIFIFLRMQYLSMTTVIDINVLSSLNLINLFLLFAIIYYYLKILHIVFYPYVLKMHFYLYQFESYDNFREWFSDNYELISTRFFTIFQFFYRITEQKREIIESYRRFSRYDKKETFKCYYLNILYLNKIARKNKLFKNIVKTNSKLFSFLGKYTSKFLYYIPHTILVLTLFYDLTQGNLHYIYYASLLYFITNMIKKIRRFYRVKDQVYDNAITTYLYRDAESYKETNKSLNTMNKLEIYNKHLGIPKEYLQSLKYNFESILEYMLNDFQAYYIIDKTRSNNDRYLYNDEKRKQIIFMYILMFIYIITNKDKYYLQMNNVYNINLWVIIIIIIISLVTLNKGILYLHEEDWAENKRRSAIFFIISIILIIAISCIILKNMYILIPSETIIDFNQIKIIVEMSYDTKIYYIQKYFKSINTNITEDIWELIFKNLTNNMTLEEMINYVKNFISKPIETKENILERVYSYIVKIINNYVKK